MREDILEFFRHMKKTFLLLTLFLFSFSAFGQWNPVSTSEGDKEISSYWSSDEGSISKTSSGVTLWHMFDFSKLQNLNGVKFKSIKVLTEVDCTKKQYRDLESYWYADAMGKGSVIHSDTKLKNDWQSVVPESNGAVLWQVGKLACDAIEARASVGEKSGTTANNQETRVNKGKAEFATGSGFFISAKGYFVTNYHVIAEAKQISIRTYDGQIFPAKLVKYDQKNDLAILKIEATTRGIPIENSSVVKRGASLVAVGFPHIDIQGLEPKVTEGIVSSLKGIKDDPRFFQISAAVQSGNSGGPLLNSSGNVIGIVSAKLGADLIFKETGDLTQNVNYAVKSSYLLLLASTLPELKDKLIKPSKRNLANTAEIFASVEKSVGLVISKISNDEFEGTERSDQSSLPKGFISQGNLTWAPIKSVSKNHAEASKACSSMSDLGFNDWRMPTARELQALQFSGKLTSQAIGWKLFITWSSTKRDKNEHFVVGLGRGEGEVAFSEDLSETPYAISCVHFNRADDFYQSVKDIDERLRSGDISLFNSVIKISQAPANVTNMAAAKDVDALEASNVWWVKGNEFFIRVFNVTSSSVKGVNFSFSSSPCHSSNKKKWVTIQFERPLEPKVEAVFHGVLPFNYRSSIGEGTKCGLIEGANFNYP